MYHDAFTFHRALRNHAIGLIAFIGLTGALLVHAQQHDIVKGGTLVAVCMEGEPAVLTAAFNVTGSSGQISTKIFDGLVRFGVNSEPLPELATSWTTSADGKEVRFHLREGVRWHDGKPFTSADVKFSFDEVWMKLHPHGRATFAAVRSVDAPDPFTVVFRLNNPSGVLFSALNSGESQILPKHLYEGTDIAKSPWNVKPVGTGAFKFKEWKRGDRIVLERNPDYWDRGKPYLDGIIYRVISDATSRLAAFESGEIMYGAGGPIALSDLERARRNTNLVVNFKGYEWLSSRIALEFNTRKAPFNDVRVRQAIAHLIDLQALSKLTTNGLSKPGTSPVLSTLPKFYATDLPTYAFSVARAEVLLDEVGLRRNADGSRFNVTIDWLPFGEIYRRYGEFVRQSLKRAGVNAEIRNQDLPGFLRRVYTDNDFDLTVTHLAVFGDPQIGTDRVYWSKAILKGVPWSNGSGYSNPKMDTLIESAHAAASEDQRVDYYRQVQRLAQQDVPSYTLLENAVWTVSSSRLRGLQVGSDSMYESLRNAWLAP